MGATMTSHIHDHARRLPRRLIVPAGLLISILGLAFSGSLVDPGSASSVALAQTDPAERVDACMQSEMASRGIHGAQMAVMRDGEMVFERAYGRKHRDRPDPVDTHTQFRIGSTTKTLTAVAIMQQVDAGTPRPRRAHHHLPRRLRAGRAGPGRGHHAAPPAHATPAACTTPRPSTSRTSSARTDPGAMGRWVDEQTRPGALRAARPLLELLQRQLHVCRPDPRARHRPELPGLHGPARVRAGRHGRHDHARRGGCGARQLRLRPLQQPLLRPPRDLRL